MADNTENTENTETPENAENTETPETVEEVESQEPQPDEIRQAIDNAFVPNGVLIVDVQIEQDPQKINMLVKVDEERPDVKVTMNFDDGGEPTTLEFFGDDVYTEDEGNQILQAVMSSFIEMLDNVYPNADTPAEDTPAEDAPAEDTPTEEA